MYSVQVLISSLSYFTGSAWNTLEAQAVVDVRIASIGIVVAEEDATGTSKNAYLNISLIF